MARKKVQKTVAFVDPASVEVPETEIMDVAVERYTEFLIASNERAVPDVRDGLKPVHRRILLAFRDNGASATSRHFKSVKIVGDCFAAGTLVSTPNGLRSIEDLDVGDLVSRPSGGAAKVIATYANPAAPLVRLTLADGRTLNATPDQFFRVVNADLSTEWRSAANLAGARLVVAGPRGQPGCSPDRSREAYVLGLLVAEGFAVHRGREADGRVRIHMVDREPLEAVEAWAGATGVRYTRSVRNLEAKGWQNQHVVTLARNDTLYSAVSSVSDEKAIPASIVAERGSWSPFIAGFFDGDGHVGTRGRGRLIELATTSPTLSRSLGALLAAMGVRFRTYEQSRPQLKNLYSIEVTGADASRLAANLLPFVRIDRKRVALEAVADVTHRRRGHQDSDRISMPDVWTAFTRAHRGGGWFKPVDGPAFRLALDRGGHSEIRYGRQANTGTLLAEREFSVSGALTAGWDTKLDMISSPLGSRLRALDGMTFLDVTAVQMLPDKAPNYDIGIDAEDHAFLVEGIVVHNCLGKYHPHGDTSVYDAAVRMSQDFALRYPLVEGKGNFGNIDGDGAAAYRYCVAGETRVATPTGTPRIDAVVAGAMPSSDHDLDLEVLDAAGRPVHASRFFHSGTHPTLRLETALGYEITGTANHPLLCLVRDERGRPRLDWKLLADIRSGDQVALLRQAAEPAGGLTEREAQVALLLGAFVSDGFISKNRAGFTSTDEAFFNAVVVAYDAVVGGRRYVSNRSIKSGSRIFAIDIQGLDALRESVLAEVSERSAKKFAPETVWRGTPALKRAFLRALYTGDESVVAPKRGVIYSTRSEELARGVQTLLLESGILSRLDRLSSGERRVLISNHRDASLFAQRIGFHGVKQQKLEQILAEPSFVTRYPRSDRVPFVSEYIRGNAGSTGADDAWLREVVDIDHIDRWERNGAAILARIASGEVREAIAQIISGVYAFVAVTAVTDAGPRPVYSIRVDTAEHAFVTNGLVSHNTEMRTDAVGDAMLADLEDKDANVVNWGGNFTNEFDEPHCLPGRFPQLLCNGILTGIGTGYSAMWLPHNLREVVDAILAVIEEPKLPAAALAKYIKGPDFPTGGIVMGTDGFKTAIETGRGSVTLRAKMAIEEEGRDTRLVITEIPWQKDKTALQDAIKQAGTKDKTGKALVEGITGVEDQTGNDWLTEMRLVVTIRKDANPKVIANQLYKYTGLQTTFAYNQMAYVEGYPQMLSIMGAIQAYISHQMDVVTRRTKFRRRKALELLEVQQAYILADKHADKIVPLARASANRDELEKKLPTIVPSATANQCKVIAGMALYRFSKIDTASTRARIVELEAEIAEYDRLLGSRAAMTELLVGEVKDIRAKFGDDRRTQINTSDNGEIKTLEELVPDVACWLTLSHEGLVGRLPESAFKAQKRGGVGVNAARSDEDPLLQTIGSRSREKVWLLTDKGNLFAVRAMDIDEISRGGRGTNVKRLVNLDSEERVVTIVSPPTDAAGEIVIATVNGKVLRARASDYANLNSAGLGAIKLVGDDRIVSAFPAKDGLHLLAVSSDGFAARFDVAGVPVQGRHGQGVALMNLTGAAKIVSLSPIAPDDKRDLALVLSNGKGKKSRLSEYPAKSRAVRGVITVDLGTAAKGGSAVAVVFAAPLAETDQVMFTTSAGKVIAMAATEIKRQGRSTAGVNTVALSSSVKLSETVTGGTVTAGVQAP